MSIALDDRFEERDCGTDLKAVSPTWVFGSTSALQLALTPLLVLGLALRAGGMQSRGPFAAEASISQARPSEEDERSWQRISDLSFPAWMALPAAKDNSRDAFKKLYLWIGSEHFSQDNLCEIFRKLSNRFGRGSLLMTAYSDKDMLKRAMKGTAGFVEFQENIEGRRYEKKYSQRSSPTDKGYFRAYYYHLNADEWFKYSKNPDSERYTYIDLSTGTPKEDLVMTLVEAVRFGDLQTAKLLIAQGVNRDVRKRTGNGLIRQQVRQNHKQMLGLLINAGENINERDEYTMTALMKAAENGDIDLTIALLDSGADIDARSNSGETALAVAARLEYSDVVTLLAERGADVNKTGVYGTTALMYAATYGDLRGIDLLASKGADPNARDRQGRTALFYVNSERDNIDTVVRELVRIGADVNAKDRNDETALIRAADSFHAELDKRLALIKALLSNGANTSLRNSTGQSALDIARRGWGDNNKMTQLLESAAKKK